MKIDLIFQIWLYTIEGSISRKKRATSKCENRVELVEFNTEAWSRNKKEGLRGSSDTDTRPGKFCISEIGKQWTLTGTCSHPLHQVGWGIGLTWKMAVKDI